MNQKTQSIAPHDLIAEGSPAPLFELPGADDKPWRLKDAKGGWVIVYFYPKDNTPGCTDEACQFRDQKSLLNKLQATVVGISPDAAATHDKFVQKLNLNFMLLADVERKVCSQYGVWQEKKNYGKIYMGVVRTTYLIDPQGKVAKRWDKVKVSGHAEQVIEDLDRRRKGT
ncbi:MAG: thioredoxin-dependent thiol peroxidase [Phycisphaeraceae bacterium]|nr:thioredoxin-dependent thiol peroxidase [Phycisphaeraceae bacterium]